MKKQHLPPLAQASLARALLAPQSNLNQKNNITTLVFAKIFQYLKRPVRDIVISQSSSKKHQATQRINLYVITKAFLCLK
ncbi:hypothetical protein EMN47_18935 [Prolixibacteraceae bacterium JC049]|nr:hypothetical protein [Prolixibacteraceae bacterium JC049]